MNTTARMKMTNASWCSTGDSHHMHHESAVAAIADAYHATRSDQRGSNLYIEICLLIIYKRRCGGCANGRSDGRHDLRFQECSTNLELCYTHLGKKNARERRAFRDDK